MNSSVPDEDNRSPNGVTSLAAARTQVLLIATAGLQRKISEVEAPKDSVTALSLTLRELQQAYAAARFYRRRVVSRC